MSALQAADTHGCDIWELLESLLEAEFDTGVCFHDQTADDVGLEFAFHFVPGNLGTSCTIEFPVNVEKLRSELCREGERLRIQSEAADLHQTLTAPDATQEDLDEFLNSLRFDPDRARAVLAEIADSWLGLPFTSHADRPTTVRQWHAAIIAALQLTPSHVQISSEASTPASSE